MKEKSSAMGARKWKEVEEVEIFHEDWTIEDFKKIKAHLNEVNEISDLTPGPPMLHIEDGGEIQDDNGKVGDQNEPKHKDVQITLMRVMRTLLILERNTG